MRCSITPMSHVSQEGAGNMRQSNPDAPSTFCPINIAGEGAGGSMGVIDAFVEKCRDACVPSTGRQRQSSAQGRPPGTRSGVAADLH